MPDHVVVLSVSVDNSETSAPPLFAGVVHNARTKLSIGSCHTSLHIS